jgi:hypothetical protein
MKVWLSIEEIVGNLSDSSELPFFSIAEYFVGGENGGVNPFFVVIGKKDAEGDGEVGVLLFFAK